MMGPSKAWYGYQKTWPPPLAMMVRSSARVSLAVCQRHELTSCASRWWDLRNRQTITSAKFPTAITSMEHSLQTQRIVLTSGKTVAFVAALPSQMPTHSLELSYTPSSASLHPILQDRFVTGNSGDQWVRIHGALEGEEREVLKGHHGPVHCIEFSPDGEMFASGSGKSA